MRETLGLDHISERRACRVLGQPRSTQRRTRHVPEDEPRLVRRIIDLATRYGRYGYRRITMMLREEGWRVNHKRIERLWRQEGLKVPAKQPKGEIEAQTLLVGFSLSWEAWRLGGAMEGERGCRRFSMAMSFR